MAGPVVVSGDVHFAEIMASAPGCGLLANAHNINAKTKFAKAQERPVAAPLDGSIDDDDQDTGVDHDGDLGYAEKEDGRNLGGVLVELTTSGMTHSWWHGMGTTVR